MKIVEHILTNKTIKKHIVKPLIKVVAPDREYNYPSFYRRNLTPAKLLRAEETNGDISIQSALLEGIKFG